MFNPEPTQTPEQAQTPEAPQAPAADGFKPGDVVKHTTVDWYSPSGADTVVTRFGLVVDVDEDGRPCCVFFDTNAASGPIPLDEIERA